MSLLKALQQRLTCVSVPWVPVGNATTCYLINEIVTGEESDEDKRGGRASHFKLYLRAMKQAGSDTGTVLALLENLEKEATIQQALTISDIPITTAAFVRHTFDVTADGRPHILAAVFAFGRDDLIPATTGKSNHEPIISLFVSKPIWNRVIHETRPSHPHSLSSHRDNSPGNRRTLCPRISCLPPWI